jgi:hypothetical protein
MEVVLPFIVEEEDLDMTEIVDAFGQHIFPDKWEFPPTRDWGINYTLVDVLYRRTGATSRFAWAQTLLEDLQFNRETGPIMLLLATAEAWAQGSFVDLDGNDAEPDLVIEIEGFPLIPLWMGSKIVRYKVEIPPTSKLTCLAEPGAKTRPLGNNQVWFCVITRCMRFMFEPIMARDGRLRIGLRSTNKMWTFLKFLQTRGKSWNGVYAQSSDFKASTDYIPLEIIKAIWDGFTWDLSPGHPFMVFYDLIVSNRTLALLDFKDLNQVLSDMSEKDENFSFTHKCGSFMGEPMSFMTLNGVNVVIDDICEFMFTHSPSDYIPLTVGKSQENILVGKVPPVDDFSRADIGPPEPACGCGDDWAAIRRYYGQIILWKSIAIQLGMVFSWKDAVSQRILIFCEDHALIRKDNTVAYVDVIKSRLLTTMTRQHSDNRSSILGKGRMLRNQLDYFENKLSNRRL